MKVETRALHQRLAECLAHCANHHEEQRAQWLLTYLSDHEAKISKTIAGFEESADPKVLNTWVYDYLNHQPIEPHRVCDLPYSTMEFDQICRSVLDLHDQALDLYRYLLGRTEIPATHELITALLAVEEQETMRLAQQSGRMHDL